MLVREESRAGPLMDGEAPKEAGGIVPPLPAWFGLRWR